MVYTNKTDRYKRRSCGLYVWIYLGISIVFQWRNKKMGLYTSLRTAYKLSKIICEGNKKHESLVYRRLFY